MSDSPLEELRRLASAPDDEMAPFLLQRSFIKAVHAHIASQQAILEKLMAVLRAAAEEEECYLGILQGAAKDIISFSRRRTAAGKAKKAAIDAAKDDPVIKGMMK